MENEAFSLQFMFKNNFIYKGQMQQTAAIFVSVDNDQNKILYIDCISTFLSLDDCFLDSAISCWKTKSWKESCLVGYSIDVSMSVISWLFNQNEYQNY